MWLSTSCTFKFDISEPTPFLSMLRPRGDLIQHITFEEFIIKPNIKVTQFQDIYGNFYQRFIAPPGKLRIQSSVEVILKDNCNIPEYIETIVRNNFFITDIEKGITTATITLIDTQLDLSSLYSQSETTINVVKEDSSITKITEYYSENGKINILVEQHISIEEVENYGDVYTYTVMLENAIANEDYENADIYSKLRELAMSKNN